MSSKYDVGEIGGKSVSYTDFQEEVEHFSTVNEIMTNSSVKNEQQQAQIRNSAWQSFIDKFLFIKNAKAAGFNVGDAEMVSLTTGDMVSPIISQNYAFMNEEGVFDPQAVADFVQNVNSDESGRLKVYWDYLQNSIFAQQFYAKYGSLFSQSDVQNPLMLKNAIAENNNTTNVDFVMVPFGFEQDSTVVVSGAEIKDFYNKHKNFFKQPASRDMEYVVFEVKPSESDITATNEEMSELYEEFATTENVKNFLMKNSDRPYSEYWYKAGELKTVSQAVSDFVDASAPGQTSTIISEGNTFYGVKVLAETMRPESISIRVISANDATEINDELISQLRVNAPFAMTQSNTVPGCEKLFDAKINTPEFINTTMYGKLLAEVVEKAEPVKMKQVAIYEKTPLASKETFNQYYSQANNFATIAKTKSYKEAIDELGVYSHVMDNVLESTANYGAIDNAKEITRWVFDNKPGKVSDIITINNNYFFIATVKGIHKEGFAKVEEVASQIRMNLYSEKLSEKKAAEVAEKIAGLNTLEEIAAALNTTVSSQSDVTFSSMKGQGLDPAFIGALSVAPEGKICGPVAGAIGTYVFQVTGRDTGSFYTEDDAKNYLAQKNQYMNQMILPVMMESAGVKDNRARFY